MKHKIATYLLTVFLLVFLANCAKRATPTGGEKDEEPPKLINAEPKAGTVNFSAEKIRLTFNEFIKLKDLQKQLIVSPPLKYPPEIFPQGSASRYIDIKIKDTLRENTTYVFNFGQSITDNNEGNPLSFFSYVFSTGETIDSLSLSGAVTDALDTKPDTFVTVMLYEIDSTYTDSTIYKKRPTYVTNTLDSATTFQLTNLKAGKYKLFALKDEGNNYLFNQKTDKIGFIENTVTVPTDSTYLITLFKETPNFRATKPSQVAKNRIVFGYEGDPAEMKIELLSQKPDSFQQKITRDTEKDTLNFWFKPTLKNIDSLVFKVSHPQKTDTFTVRMKDMYRDSLSLKNLSAPSLNFRDTLTIQASTPIQHVKKELISVIDKDSTFLSFTTNVDSLNNRLKLKWDTKPENRYKITLLPGAVEDFFGNTNDTLNYSAGTKALSSLGSIRVTLVNAKSYPLIVQLTDNKGVVKYEMFSEKEIPLYDFRDIEPGNYKLRVIYDENGNRRWDTGNYLQNRQPEKISYLSGAIELRPNWEWEQEFILK